eukprot:TRINITY_DN2297_c0_g1_i1.p1 TRINITY_DN2297_c0_g1~~TRINITY_DN2297_c0_g1_i1.p1  ORF type:complete len:358 (-),score=93.45 TRINITY_DN2297_c0_g1_i1:124-1197(-)
MHWRRTRRKSHLQYSQYSQYSVSLSFFIQDSRFKMCILLWLVVGVALLVYFLWCFGFLKKGASYEGKHVLITGGSSGIGLSIALQLSKLGANVTIISRSVEKLKKSVDALEKNKKNDSQKFQFLSMDVKNDTQVKNILGGYVKKNGVPDYLYTCAGLSVPGFFVEQSIEQHHETMSLDYFGTLHVVHTILPMMKMKKKGHVVLFSSTAGMVGIIGYSTYSPAKFALRGLADVLRNEMAPYGVKFSIVYPPDTDTPGFREEMKTKPPACKEISEFGQGEPFPAESVAMNVVSKVAMGDYHVTADVGTELLVMLTAAASPRRSLLLDMIALPIASLLGKLFTLYTDWVVRKHAKHEKSS